MNKIESVNTIQSINSSAAYKASVTREQFLFFEVRMTAKLLSQGLNEQEAVSKIVEENLFQISKRKIDEANGVVLCCPT